MKHKLLTLASAAALLAACSDSSVSDANDEIKDKATVTFMVVDNNTILPLENVEDTVKIFTGISSLMAML